MRVRHATGGVRKQRGRWVGLWYENGIKKSRTLGSCQEMTKSDAREAVRVIVRGLARKQEDGHPVLRFDDFVEEAYFGFYKRKWKPSTAYNNISRIRTHLIARFGAKDLRSFKRDELQDLLDLKARTLSFSMVDHLRWDCKAIFDMAIAEGLLSLNPALLLFTPKEAPRPIHRTMTIEDVRCVLIILGSREKLIAKLTILAGLRPGEIFGLTWPRIEETFARVEQRVYRGLLDTPKTHNSVRSAALASGLRADLQAWREMVPQESPYVFPSEDLTPLSKDNVWHRYMQPRLDVVGLGWCNFQVMRRTHASIMKRLKADPKLVADQMGHTLDVNQNIYTQSPVELRLELVNQLEALLIE
jgi:integrase